MKLSDTPAGRRLLFAALYFSEGAPIGFLWWALPTLLREGGVEVGRITALTAALAVPWSLKFLPAMLIDLSGGRRRVWIVSCQAAMAVTLVPLTLFEWRDGPDWLFGALIVHALFASLQDASIDAYAIALSSEAERGRLTAAMQTGMLSGRWLFGAGLLLVLSRVGPNAAVVCMAIVLILASAIVVFGAGAAPMRGGVRSTGELAGLIRSALGERRFRLGLWLAVVGGAGYEAVGALAGPFLIDRGLGAEQTGWFFSVSIVLMAAGAWTGGLLSDRIGPRRATLRSLLFVAAAVTGVAAAVGSGQSIDLVFLGSVYFCLGAFTAASYALLMNLTDPRLGGVEFSTFMGGTNLCEAWAGFGGGRIAAGFGYPAAFAVMAAASLFALPALFALRREEGPGRQ